MSLADDIRAGLEVMAEEERRLPLGRPHECALHPDIYKGKVVQCWECRTYYKIVDGEIYHARG